MPGIVLTYHSMNVLGNAYGDNDHVALAADLRMLDAAGWRIVPLERLVDAWEADALHGERLVALSFDDGGALDARDVVHPSCGPQRSFLGILRAFREEAGARQPELHASSFVIASPEARAELDRKDFLGLGWWGDDWWREAGDSGLLAIESHSWDHNHPSLSQTAMAGAPGRFDTLATPAEAEAELARASDYIEARCGRRPRFFAWPWGQVSGWARDSWLPQHAGRIGLRAAFSTEPAPLDARSHRFALPRHVCGEHWRSPLQLAMLLDQAARAGQGMADEDSWDGVHRKLPAALRKWIHITEVDDGGFFAGELFHRKFGDAPPPAGPGHHVVAFVRTSEGATVPIAYLYFHPLQDMVLVGGGCTDGRAFAHLPEEARDGVRAAGGLLYYMLHYGFARYGDTPAFFGHCGDARAREVDLRAGFRDTGIEHLLIYTPRPLPPDQRAALITRAHALGPF